MSKKYRSPRAQRIRTNNIIDGIGLTTTLVGIFVGAYGGLSTKDPFDAAYLILMGGAIGAICWFFARISRGPS